MIDLQVKIDERKRLHFSYIPYAACLYDKGVIELILVNIGTRWLENTLASSCILQPTRANIHKYQFNNPIVFNVYHQTVHLFY